MHGGDPGFNFCIYSYMALHIRAYSGKHIIHEAMVDSLRLVVMGSPTKSLVQKHDDISCKASLEMIIEGPIISNLLAKGNSCYCPHDSDCGHLGKT